MNQLDAPNADVEAILKKGAAKSGAAAGAPPDDDGSSADGGENDLEPGNQDVEEEEEVEEEEVIPPEVHRRVHALKNIQMDIVKLETEFYREMHELECKYLPLYQPHFEKRRQITSGEYEPTDKECEFTHGDPEEIAQAMAKINLATAANDGKEKVKGMPEFWLKIFKNVEMLQDMIEVPDEPILKHLVDITVEISANPMGFKLHFHFSPNEYFSNPVLTKTYTMKCEPDPEDPFQFEGPEIVSCSGCLIDWAKGKNVTVKVVRKKQKQKSRGQTPRTVQKTVTADSFFNFFNPPQVPEGDEVELDEQTQIKLTTDFEIGQYIRERIIPHAVLYYTGEALDDEYEEEEEEDEEGLEDEDDDEGGGY
jgi:nucleosome assembly protein 1-like 1